MLRKKVITVVSLIMCSFFLFSCSNDPVVYDNHGQPVQLSLLKGKWVVINYWADWCAACRAEVEELNSFHQHSAGKDYVLYGVVVDKYTPESQDASIQLAGVKFPNLRENPGSSWGLSRIEAIPTTFIIDPDGRLVKTLVGGHTEQSLLETLHVLKAS
jgi:thiol-disulfide isomerase/thioredoxin